MGELVQFTATIEPTDNGAFVEVPRDAVAALGATGRTSVTGSIDGESITSQVMPYSFEAQGRRVVLAIPKALRAAIGKGVGDAVAVVLERDDRSRSANVAVPRELSDALAADAQARQAFDALAPSRRRERATFVAEAKREETRRRRADRVVQLLRGD